MEQLQCACPCIQITLKITHVHLIVLTLNFGSKTTNLTQLCGFWIRVSSLDLYRAAQGFYLIPVSGVGEAAGGVSEAENDEKIRGNGAEGTFNKDMTNVK